MKLSNLQKELSIVTVSVRSAKSNFLEKHPSILSCYISFVIPLIFQDIILMILRWCLRRCCTRRVFYQIQHNLSLQKSSVVIDHQLAYQSIRDGMWDTDNKVIVITWWIPGQRYSLSWENIMFTTFKHKQRQTGSITSTWNHIYVFQLQ